MADLTRVRSVADDGFKALEKIGRTARIVLDDWMDRMSKKIWRIDRNLGLLRPCRLTFSLLTPNVL